ncbi:MAG: type II secretion system F family protein [Nitrospirae bacterium]|nr:type II secretion system F family protein [Nitrospirota bacterium]
MANFKWTGKTRQGTMQKGVLAAKNKDDVIALLRKQNILVTSVQQAATDIKISIPGIGGRVKDKDIAVFTRQFATMIDAGLPLVQCLEILSTQSENKSMAAALKDIRQDVESGATFTDALRKHPKVFNDLYVNMVAAGEAGGILDTILNRLAAYIEKAMKLKAKVKAALVYPGVIVSVAVIVVTVLLVWVIPVFAKMFTDMGGTLPLPTRIVMGTSDAVRGNIIFVVIAIILLVVGLKYAYKSEKGKRIVDSLLLKAPVFGPLIRKVAVAKFTRTLSTLISSGVPILDGLEIVSRTAGNKVVEDALMGTRQSISEGKTIADPLGKAKVFPPMVVQMISVGEATGALDAMLSKIADFYDEEVDNAVAALTSMLEPMLMVFLGVIVGFIVIAMYLPIFQMAALVGH